MPTKKPYFSVIMPTYNRANLLPLAIKSVLEQTFEDLELVICNGGSTDETKDVVAKFDDNRIRYIESKERLSIGDNYQYALNHATGEYLTFLSDDDAFAPIMLERVFEIINRHQAQMVSFQFCRYFHDSDFHYNRNLPPNTLVIHPFTSEVTAFEPEQCLKELFAANGLSSHTVSDDKFITPFLANAVYHHKIFLQLNNKVLKLFASTPADMYLAAAVFFVADSYHCLDEPLHIWSQWADNATASPSKKGNKLRAHYEKLLNGETLKFTPLKFALPNNCGINAMLQAKSDFENEQNIKIEVDWLAYYLFIYHDLLNLKKLGVDTKRESRELHDSLAAQSVEFQNKFNSEINNKSQTAKQFLLNNLPSGIADFLLRLRGHQPSYLPNLLNGGEQGFTNALEAARFLGMYVKSKVN